MKREFWQNETWTNHNSHGNGIYDLKPWSSSRSHSLPLCYSFRRHREEGTVDPQGFHERKLSLFLSWRFGSLFNHFLKTLSSTASSLCFLSRSSLSFSLSIFHSSLESLIHLVCACLPLVPSKTLFPFLIPKYRGLCDFSPFPKNWFTASRGP